MRAHPIRFLSVLLSLGVVLIAPSSGGLQAQTTLECKCTQPYTLGSQRSLVLQGGGWLVDLDATVVAARVELPMGRSGRWLFVPGLTFGHGDLQTGPTQTDVLVPEALVHYQLSRGRFRPYVGGGAGLSLVNLLGRTLNGVVTVASGMRFDLTPQWGARVEADMRIFGFTRAGTIGWGLGISRRF
jgi:hypothetical protein